MRMSDRRRGVLTLFVVMVGFSGSAPARAAVGSADELAPQITSFSPSSGVAGTSVTITGRYLEGATSVRFNGLAAELTSDSATVIVATVPVGATTGAIEVVTAAGTARSESVFTVVTGEGGDHARELSFELRRALIARGAVVVPDGTQSCSVGVTVNIQRRLSGRWTTVQSTRTTRSGTYRVQVVDVPGRYRAKAPSAVLPSGDICGGTWSRTLRR